jgi:autonomous glycyl radical cofactor GrcA
MKTSDAFPSRYLQTATVKAKPIVATISDVEMELVGQGADQKRKPVLHLEGEKPMVLNRTNFETLADAFGDSDEWPGHKIKVYAIRTQYAGKSIDGLRVEPIVPKPALKGALNDEVPAF